MAKYFRRDGPLLACEMEEEAKRVTEMYSAHSGRASEAASIFIEHL